MEGFIRLRIPIMVRLLSRGNIDSGNYLYVVVWWCQAEIKINFWFLFTSLLITCPTVAIAPLIYFTSSKENHGRVC